MGPLLLELAAEPSEFDLHLFHPDAGLGNGRRVRFRQIHQPAPGRPRFGQRQRKHHILEIGLRLQPLSAHLLGQGTVKLGAHESLQSAIHLAQSLQGQGGLSVVDMDNDQAGLRS